MAFLRSSTGQESAVTCGCGAALLLRSPLMGDYAALGRAEGAEPRAPDPVGADVARDELSRAPFAAACVTTSARSREDLGYAFLIFASRDDQLARRPHPDERAPRRGAGGLGRLLARRCRTWPRPHDGSGARGRQLRFRRSCICTGSRRRRCPTTLPRSACWSAGFRREGWRAAISRSTASGKTTFCTPCSRDARGDPSEALTA